MSCGAEFRGRQEGRVKNGVKNLKESKAIPQNLFQSRNWKCLPIFLNLIFLKNRVILQKTSTGRSLEKKGDQCHPHPQKASFEGN